MGKTWCVTVSCLEWYSIDNTQTHSNDGNVTVIAARANLINLFSHTALMSRISNATAISSSGPTQAFSNVGTPTCAGCGLIFSRFADLHRHSDVHLPERRKYCCVVKSCKDKNYYRKDELISHVKNRHERVSRKGMIWKETVQSFHCKRIEADSIWYAYEVRKESIRNGLRTATALSRKSNEHANSQM